MARQKWAKALLFGVGLVVGAGAGVKAAQSIGRSARHARESDIPHGKTIVILGGGFGGIHVAEELCKLLPPESKSKIVLIDRNNFLLFTPMLTEVAGGQVDARDVVCPIRYASSRIQFERGRVDKIDLDAKRVIFTVGSAGDGVPDSQRTLQADHLVIALGSVTSYHNLPGVQKHSLTIKKLADAAAIRNRALALLERAGVEPGESKRRALLTVVVGGGGFAGVETMAAVNALLRDGVRRYPSLRAADVRSVLIHPGQRLLPELDAKLASYAQREMEKRGVEIKLNAEIGAAGAGFVQIKDGPRIPSHLLIWAAGVTPTPAIASLDCKRGPHGGIMVDECCAVPDHPGVWALGDCADIPHPNGQKTYAPTAQNAMREGAQVARNVVAALSEKEPQPFVYQPIGELAIVGKRAGVARIYGKNFSGLPAWAMWRTIYLAKMPGVSHRIRIVVDWMTDMIFGRDISVLPIRSSSVD